MKETDILTAFVCPDCHGALTQIDAQYVCGNCQKKYVFKNGIPDFRDQDEYWCNVSREKMQRLNRLAQENGDWFQAAKEVVPTYMEHFVPFYRADSQFLWPTTKDSRILDAGCMWGGLTIPAAQFHGDVYAIDKTLETVEFLKIRAEQKGFDNIHAAASGLEKLPFPDDFFDLVILNGVLEWTALKAEIILERHWGKFGCGLRPQESSTYSEDPRAMQLRVLQEINRVLKPGGGLYLAIENRIGYIYLVGYPDAHMNIPFICFMPRVIANAITKLILNCKYRTYIYTVLGYKALLEESNFFHIDFYGVFMHYIKSSEIVPLELIKDLKGKILATKRGLNKILLSLIPKSLLKWLSPSVVAIAIKGSLKPNNEPRMVQLLKKAGLLENNAAGVEIVKCDSREGSDLTVNHWIYCDNKPKYFCKVCRNKESTEVLDVESKNLKAVSHMLQNTELDANIPKLLYYGTIDNITFTVMEFVDGKTYPSKRTRLKWAFQLSGFNKRMCSGIELLVKFQKFTHIKNVKVSPYLISTIEEQKQKLKNRGELTEALRRPINEIIDIIKGLGDIEIPKCAVHGDYDPCNLMFHDGKITLLDFEHFQKEGFPFFDLANLMFNSLLITYGDLEKGMPLSSIIKKYRLNRQIDEWLRFYSELSGVPLTILRLIGPIAALEQRTMDYPSYRDPNTYPMFKKEIFADLITVRL